MRKNQGEKDEQKATEAFHPMGKESLINIKESLSSPTRVGTDKHRMRHL
jgi:hypothetical protein